MSHQQIEQLGEDQKRRFVAQLMQRLRRDFPAQTRPLDDPALRDLIETGTRHAELYGLVTEAHIRVYCGLMLRHGADFDADPTRQWAGDILNDGQLSAREKISRLDGVQAFLDQAPPA